MPKGDSYYLADIVPSGFFLARTPLLPFDEIVNWAEGLDAPDAAEHANSEDALQNAWERDVTKLRRRLSAAIARPEIRQALFIASPSVDSALDAQLRDPSTRKGRKLERTLVRYFVRMAGRPTPFGLFAGCSLGRIGRSPDSSTELKLDLRKTYSCNSRLDNHYLFSLAILLQREPSLREKLRYWPNSSLHRVHDEWHYIETKIAGNSVTHHVVKVSADEYLNAVLDAATSGATKSALASAILDVDGELDISPDEASGFLDELIDNNLLVTSLTPLITGGQPVDDLVSQTESISPDLEVTKLLRAAQKRLMAIDQRPLGADPSEYRSIAESLKKLPAVVEPARLFQVDMAKPVQQAVLSSDVVEEMLTGLDALCRIATPTDQTALKSFAEAFARRYERASVPLLEALHDETGVGLSSSAPLVADASPLLRGLQVQTPVGQGRVGPSLSETHLFLLQKLQARAAEGNGPLMLEATELPSRPSESVRIPDAFATLVTIVASSAHDIGDGDYTIVLERAFGPSGARMLGRFCHAVPQLEEAVREHLRCEERNNQEAIYAEIVHLPEGRIGNVICRPILREYEIAYLGRSGAPIERQIPVSDLMVAVEGGEIVLYSKALGRRVVPRMTTMHNYMQSKLAPVYQFLCRLQAQHITPWVGLDWGPLEGLDYLPRVCIGRCVIALARWRISRDEAKQLGRQEGAKCFRAVQDLRRRRRLPRWIEVVDGDNTLPVDLDNALCVDTFVDLVKRRPSAVVRELYPEPGELWVTGPEGRFVHQLVVPFVRCPPAAENATVSRSADYLSTQTDPAGRRRSRAFPPGSEWLYVSVYGGVAALDDVLTTAASEVIRNLMTLGAIRRWFFIRYGDPDWHLRFRFQGDPNRLSEDVFPALNRAFQELLVQGKIWKFEYQTYEREIERYGGVEGARAAEDIFWADSESVTDILQMFQGDDGLDARWRLALVGIDRLFDDLGLDINAKLLLTRKMRDAFYKEYRVASGFKRRLGDRFRQERESIEDVLGATLSTASSLASAMPIFEVRSSRVKPVASALRQLRSSGKLGIEVSDLASSYAHMHVNRMIRSASRAHELVLYDMLYRVNDGRRARKL